MKKGIVCGLLVALCVVLFAVNLAKGSIDIPLADVVRILT